MLKELILEWTKILEKKFSVDFVKQYIKEGINDHEIKKLENKLGIKLPEEFITFYTLQDYQDNAITTIFELSGDNNYPYSVLSFKKIIREISDLDDLNDDDANENPYGALEISKAINTHNKYYNSKWIPFAHNSQGDYLLIDLDPSASGQYGQIIELQNESWERNLLANSLTKLLEDNLKKLHDSSYFYQIYETILKDNNLFKHHFDNKNISSEKFDMTRVKTVDFQEVANLFPKQHVLLKEAKERDIQVHFIDGDWEIDNLNLSAPFIDYEKRFSNYQVYIKEQISNIILIKGKLKAKNIYNEYGFSMSLFVTGDLHCENIITESSELNIQGSLIVNELFWGDSNEGVLKVGGEIQAGIFVETNEYQCNLQKVKSKYLFSDLKEEQKEEEFNEGAIRSAFTDDALISEEFTIGEEHFGWDSFLKEQSTIIDLILNGYSIIKKESDNEEDNDNTIFNDYFFKSVDRLQHQLLNYTILMTHINKEILTNNTINFSDLSLDVILTRNHINSGQEVPENIAFLFSDFSIAFLKKTNSSTHLELSYRSKESEQNIFDDTIRLEKIIEAWRRILDIATKSIKYTQKIKTIANASAINAILNLAVVRAKYDDYQDSDKMPWLGNISFAFDWSEEAYSTVRLTHEIPSDEFDVCHYYFDVYSDNDTRYRHWSSQSCSTSDAYSQDNRVIQFMDYVLLKKAIKLFSIGYRAIIKHNDEYLNEQEKLKKALELKKQAHQLLIENYNPQKPFDSIVIAGTSFSIKNRKEVISYLEACTDFDNQKIYEPFNILDIEDDTTYANGFFLVCEEEPVLDQLTLEAVVKYNNKSITVLAYIFLKDVTFTRHVEAHSIDFSPALICLSNIKAGSILAYGSTHYFHKDCHAENIYGEYDHGRLIIKGTAHISFIFANNFAIYINELFANVTISDNDKNIKIMHDLSGLELEVNAELNILPAFYRLESCLNDKFIYQDKRGKYLLKDNLYHNGDSGYPQGEESFLDFLKKGMPVIDDKKIENIYEKFNHNFIAHIENLFSSHPDLSKLPDGELHYTYHSHLHSHLMYYFQNTEHYYHIGHWNTHLHFSVSININKDNPKDSSLVVFYWNENNDEVRYQYTRTIEDNSFYALIARRFFFEALSSLNTTEEKQDAGHSAETFSELKDIFIHHQQEDIYHKIRNRVKNGISLILAEEPNINLPLGQSKLGGTPDFPKGWIWPVNPKTKKPLAFIAQINLSTLTEYDAERKIPEAGWLYFFYDAEEQPWGFDPDNKCGNQVLHFSGDLSELENQQFPKRLVEDCRFDTLGFSFKRTLEIPDYNSTIILPDEFSDSDAYTSIFEALNNNGSGNKILGHAECIQNGMELECELISRGIYTGDGSAYQLPSIEQHRRNSSQWQLLLQVESNEDIGMMWGDSGRLYWWIKSEDLKNKNFSASQLILQCY